MASVTAVTAIGADARIIGISVGLKAEDVSQAAARIVSEATGN